MLRVTSHQLNQPSRFNQGLSGPNLLVGAKQRCECVSQNNLLSK